MGRPARRRRCRRGALVLRARLRCPRPRTAGGARSTPAGAGWDWLPAALAEARGMTRERRDRRLPGGARAGRGARRTPLAGDASARRYERLARGARPRRDADGHAAGERARARAVPRGHRLAARAAGSARPRCSPPTRRAGWCCWRTSATTSSRGSARATPRARARALRRRRRPARRPAAPPAAGRRRLDAAALRPGLPACARRGWCPSGTCPAATGRPVAAGPRGRIRGAGGGRLRAGARRARRSRCCATTTPRT